MNFKELIRVGSWQAMPGIGGQASLSLYSGGASCHRLKTASVLCSGRQSELTAFGADRRLSNAVSCPALETRDFSVAGG